MICKLVLNPSLKSNLAIFHSKYASSSLQPKNVNSLYEKCKSKLFEYMTIYEEAIGIKEVRQAQDLVQNAEKSFSKIQEERRTLNSQLIETQDKIRKIREELDRMKRTDSNYLTKITEEHNLFQLEEKLISGYRLKEEEERAAFFKLSSALRDAQQKERIRVERIKYLQLGMSIVCTALGLLSAYLLNYFRNSNIREILEYDREHFKTLEDSVKTIIEKQDGIETNFESMMTKWNSSFKVSDEAASVDLIQSPQLIQDTIQSGDFYESDSKIDYKKYYVKAALMSALLIVSGIYFFQNK